MVEFGNWSKETRTALGWTQMQFGKVLFPDISAAQAVRALSAYERNAARPRPEREASARAAIAGLRAEHGLDDVEPTPQEPGPRSEPGRGPQGAPNLAALASLLTAAAGTTGCSRVTVTLEFVRTD
jgi:hypothetical protein